MNIELDEIEKQVDKELKENGFTRDDFSAEELKDLKDEIKRSSGKS